MDSSEFASEYFDESAFVKRSVGGSGGGDELRRLREVRARVAQMADDSSQSIKRNVFHNYRQFIDTAKQISYLEGEMYQLSHLLTEQKTLIDQMVDVNYATAEKPSEDSHHSIMTDSEKRKSMQSLLDRVEHSTHLADIVSRYVIFESDLKEINIETATDAKTIHAFLLNDGLLIASILPQKMGQMRYGFEAFHPLDNVYVTSVNDLPAVKHLFKMSVFPDHKYFACDSAQTKSCWLTSVEKAQTEMLQRGSLVRQATIRTKKRAEQQRRLASLPSVADDDFSFDAAAADHAAPTVELEWLRELPDEVDVCIAQRDFDQALELLLEGRENVAECADEATAREVTDKLAQKQRQLVDVLGAELRVTADKTLQGGPKAARRAITLLIKLDKSSQACDLYLKKRSAVLKASARELRIAEDPLSYLRQLCRVVFSNLADVAREFSRLFANNAGCCSVLLLWASGEVRAFVSLVLRHVFDSGAGLSVLGRCLNLIFTHCQELSEVGLDLTFEVDKLLTPAVEKAIDLNGQNFLEAIRLRIAEDKGRPYNLQSEANLNRFTEEMADMGLRLDAYVCETEGERCHLWLTAAAVHFARTVLPLSRDLPALRLSELGDKCDGLLGQLWAVQLRHEADALADGQRRRVADECARFLCAQLLPLADRAYSASPLIGRLVADDFPSLLPYCAADDDGDHEEEVVDV